MLSNKIDLSLFLVINSLVNFAIACLIPYLKDEISKIFAKDKKGIINLFFFIVSLMYVNIMAIFLFILVSVQ